MAIIVWLILGSIIGLIVNSLMPGPVSGGVSRSAACGVFGAVAGGLSASYFYSTAMLGIETPSVLMSVCGALGLVFCQRCWAVSAGK